MKVFILLFPFIVVTCQAYQLPMNRRQVARQGDPESKEPSVNDQFYEKLKTLATKYILDDAVDADPQTLLVPDVYKPSDIPSRKSYKTQPGSYDNRRITNPAVNRQCPNPIPSRINNPALHQQNYNLAASRFSNPGVHTRYLINESVQLRQVAQADRKAQLLQQDNAERAARLAAVDREALNKLSEEDRQILESKLSPTERKALLVKLEDGQLNDLFPREENRFGSSGSSMGGFSVAAAQIGASAGGYIGGKLAGILGAKLGAAAGAYLGAAAASRFVKKTKAVSEIVSNIISNDVVPAPPSRELKYGATVGDFGALMLNN